MKVSPSRSGVGCGSSRTVSVLALALKTFIPLAWLLLSLPATAAETFGTAEIFSRDKEKVVQVRIIDKASGTKSTIGSGFYVSADGLIITNFHVISDLVHHPERATAEIVRNDFKREPGTLVGIDIVHDLALIRAESGTDQFVATDPEKLKHGQRIFAFGNPQDLGLTIVEGSYSGLLENSLYEKIHFTGSLNPGMSGGPTVSLSGNLVGVNVSTEGNQISFLVPAKFVTALIERSTQESEPAAANFLDAARTQLLANQERYMEALLANPFSRSRLAHCSLPNELTPAFKCWSRADDSPTYLYTSNLQNCSIEDEIFVHESLSTGTIEFEHMLLTSRGLNRFQFYSKYEEIFGNLATGAVCAEEDDVTNFHCSDSFVDVNGTDFMSAFCLRAYKQLQGLYDAVLIAASVDRNSSGVMTRATLTGVSWENAQAFGKKYLSTIVCGT